MEHSASHISDVVRTTLVWGTVAFLGYLGYALLDARPDNPPPLVITQDSDVWQRTEDTLQALSDELASVRARTDVNDLREGLDQGLNQVDVAISRLERRLDALMTERAANRDTPGQWPAGTAMEYGTIIFQRPADYDKEGCRRIKFKYRYTSPPLVLTSQLNRTKKGNEIHWLAGVPEKVTRTGAQICVHVLPENRKLKYEFAYLVIGQVAE